jgi:DNA repair protein RadA/Sms
MAKASSVYICQQCGYQSPSWMGKCPECGTWGSLIETIEESQKSKFKSQKLIELEKLAEVKAVDSQRMTTGFEEFDRVLGGGIVGGSVILLAGDPGIGKSTLLLKLAENVASLKKDKKVLYVSGEESAFQIKLRANRVFASQEKKQIPENLYVVCQTDVDAIANLFWENDFSLVVVDSIQTMTSEELSGSSGSIGQVKYATQVLHKAAKEKNIPLFLVGHVTKEGAVAGPRVVEHLVDVVLYLEGEEFSKLRLLRAIKNRFGTIMEVGVFEMAESGMIEVLNPSELFLSQRRKNTPGSIVVPTLQGRRPILAEIQALVTPTSFGMPRRVATGVDYNRLLMIIAVLSKRVNLPLGNSDIYINIAGGLKIFEPACDLGIALAITSAAKFLPISDRLTAVGEVGLLGEVREVAESKRRLTEAKKLGFKTFLTSHEAPTLEQAVKFVLNNH